MYIYGSGQPYTFNKICKQGLKRSTGASPGGTLTFNKTCNQRLNLSAGASPGGTLRWAPVERDLASKLVGKLIEPGRYPS